MKGTQITHHTNKGANKEVLPNRHALNQVSKGDVGQRSIGNYAKATPGIDENGQNLFGSKPARGSNLE